MIDLAAIVISHNHGIQAKRVVASFFNLCSTVKAQLVLVNNTQENELAEWVSQCYPQVRLVQNFRPQGFAQNNNFAFRLLPPCRYVLLLNPDVECMPGLIEILVSFMDAHPDVGIAGPRLLNSDGTHQASARQYSTPQSILIRGLHLDGIMRNSRLMKEYLMTDLSEEHASDVDWVSGALMIARRKAMDDVGPMDERYYLYSEDQDWCCRMWRKGWRVCYVPQACAIHAHPREGITKPWSKSARYQLISALRMFQKFGWKLSRTK